MFRSKSNSGKSITARLTVFKASDGRIVSNGEQTLNRRNDPARNWGLPD